jgi:hypothetical protein
MSFILVWFFVSLTGVVDYDYSSKAACMADAKRMIVESEVKNPTMMICEKKPSRVFSHVQSYKQATSLPL